MINTTDKPAILESGVNLDLQIREALAWTERTIAKQLQDTRLRPHVRLAFARLLGEENLHTRELDEPFLEAAYEIVASDSQNTGTREPMGCIKKYVKEPRASATTYAYVKRGLRILFVKLWTQRVLMLPTLFTLGPGFTFEYFDNELLRWIAGFDSTSKDGTRKADYPRMRYFGPRLLLATDWANVQDVALNQIADLNLAQIRYARGEHPYIISGSPFPWLALPSYLLRDFPDRVTFTKEDLNNYSAWAVHNSAGRGRLEEFVFEDPIARRKRLKRKRRAEQGRKNHGNSRPRSTGGSHPKTEATFDSDRGSIKTHQAVLQICKQVLRKPRTSMDWRAGVPVYPGREQLNISEFAGIWIESFKAWLNHRKAVQGYRSDQAVLASLNILADYLFFYLPWWRELYPDGAIDLPRAPKDFSRYAFVSRHVDEPIERLPITLLEFVKLRRSTSAESQATVIRHIVLYFRFIDTHFHDDDRIGGMNFKNPLDDEFDLPRIKGKKNKTNKIVIPPNIYGHLLFWCYAVEAFGQNLLSNVLNGILSEYSADVRSSHHFRSEVFGGVPKFTYRGREISVTSIPNVFSWVERDVYKDGEVKRIAIPHATALRLLIVTLETGLRAQSIQWLDRTTWDSLNDGTGPQYTYRLLVNTDKTKTEAWAPPIVYRVRQALQREAAFQELFVDYDAFEAVPYEGGSSPFEDIRPLFRAPTSGRPISDNAYADVWVRLLAAFQDFYRELTGERHVQLVYLKRQVTEDDQPVIRYNRNDSFPYCPLSILAVYTPHSCRATFATNRQGHGILELSDVAEILGHEGIATTSHYTKLSADQLADRLGRSDSAILGEYSVFEIGPRSEYLRADKPDSPLVKSFRLNREAAVEAFKFMPSMALWSIEDGKQDEHDGLALLKSGPMSHIRFRETHICPVGEECPTDIIRQNGRARLCGICPLAMKCIDHLPAIAAKRNQLLERVQFLQMQRKQMEAAGEPVAALDAHWDEIQLTINELLGWQFSEEILHRILSNERERPEIKDYVLVDRPDIVRRHLSRVVRKSDKTEFLLQRLGESNAYPSMTSPQVQMAAALLRRRLSAGEGLDDIASAVDGDDDIRFVSSQLAVFMKTAGITMKELSRALGTDNLTLAPPHFTLLESQGEK